jgi:hypothetical protein
VVFEKAWSGDWHGRILERVSARGFKTVTRYVSERPGVSLRVLARELGSDDVAASQLRSILVSEALRTGTVPRALRDLFVRELRQYLPDGWQHPLDSAARARVGRALATWLAELRLAEHLDCFDDDMMFDAGQDFMNADLPPGWLPEGPDDPVIITFVDRCLGHDPS